jgi:cholesterol oxidase
LKSNYDFVIIGSGFGGSITACRLAEAQRKLGRKVSICVLERGKRYHRGEFPRDLRQPKEFLWRDDGRRGWRGLVDFRTFPNISVLQASGVGGTSLMYANVQIVPFESSFQIVGPEGNRRWPKAIQQVKDLEKYYSRVAEMMRPSPIPEPPLKALALKAAADAAGVPERFRLLDLAIYWGKNGAERGVLREDPFDRKSSAGIAGPPQIGCSHCGECVIGCNTHSKNTVDLHYLWLAERMGAEVHSQHRVAKIEPIGADGAEGYQVHYEDYRWNFSGTVRARRLIVAAGSLGSTELLLRSKVGYKSGKNQIQPTLPGLSNMLGRYFSANGDIFAAGFETNRTVNLMDGPTITAALDYRDKLDGHGFLVEEGGFPDVLRSHLMRFPGGIAQGRRFLNLFRRFADLGASRQLTESIFRLLDFDTVRDALPYLTMGVDAADGVMSIDDAGTLQINWNNEKSLSLYREIEKTLRELTESRNPGLDGNLMVNPVWTVLKQQMTPHPLGGCPMGDDPSLGVVSPEGKVYGYKNLYVADGSIVPSALGPNPSKTIGALAERISEKMIEQGI